MDDNQPTIHPHLLRPQGWSPKFHQPSLDSMPDAARDMVVLTNLFSYAAKGQDAERLYWFYTNPEAVHLTLYPAHWTPWLKTEQTNEPLQELLPFITDEKIRHLCEALSTQMDRLDDLNQELGRALAKLFKQPFPNSEAGFQSLREQADQYREDNGPAWLDQADFPALIASLLQIVMEIKSLAIRLQVNLQPLMMRVSANQQEIGDQRAKDLIDKAAGQSDPKRAIRILKESLRYGGTGVQASKAYLELGRLSADAGNTQKAIEYYTQSILAYKEPNPMALYWRGELFYKMEVWMQARADLEQALSLGIYSPEQEQAQAYLSDIQARTSAANL